MASRLETMGLMTVRRSRQDRGRDQYRMAIGLSGLATLVAVMPAPASAAIEHAGPSATMGRLHLVQASALMPAQDAAIDFALPAMPLDEALAAYGAASGVQLIYDSSATRHLRSIAVVGRYDRAEGLRRLLAGTGLTPQFTAERSATLLRVVAQAGIVAPDQAGAVALDMLEVSGENAIGPVHGYVARRSATATKTGTPILETPQAINVVGRKEIEDRQAQSVSQALLYTPGVMNQYGTDVRYDWLYVRGFVPGRYLDGLRLPFGARGYSQPRVESYGLERVELLKGPSSGLYGQNSPGGLLNLVSKRPTATPLREIQLQTGSFGRAQAAFDLSGPIDPEGRILYRLTGLARTTGTQLDYLEEDRVFIAPSLTLRPDADTSLTILSQYLNIDSPGGGAPQGLPALGTLYANPKGRIPTKRFIGEPNYDRFKLQQGFIGYAFEHRFNDVWTVRQNLRYSHVDANTQRVQAIGLGADNSTLSRYAWAFPERSDLFNIDNQAEARFSTGPFAHTLLLGADYLREDARYDESQLRIVPSVDVFAPVYAGTVTRPPLGTRITQGRNQTGLYAQDEIRFGGFRLTVSGRQDWADAVTRTTNAATGALTRVKQDDAAFTGRVGLSYLLDGGLAPYISYATSFQPTAGTNRAGQPFAPTEGEQIEGGIKFQPPGTNLLMTGTVFDLTQKNVLTPDPTDFRFNAQTGEARVRGVELEVKASLTESLDLIASYAAMNSEITKANANAAGASIIGNELPFVPQHQASAWLDYTFRTGDWAGLGLGAGVRYIGASVGDNANLYHIPVVTLVDAAVRYDFGYRYPALKGVDLAVNATNLFDKTYVSTCIAATGCFYGNRQTVLATLRYRW
ncbi:TonB-dependent siderophore receptor [Methylobacterium sp. Leaf91]|uniref:TonB-dependent siderophore receptor n=2 Tax=unclassified Methylobacterium TaxID=2615210 RepID=UPI001FCD67D9|nr:TonB-dependent siderophore receptor [Methylobacterium sp. Leaf91]